MIRSRNSILSEKIYGTMYQQAVLRIRRLSYCEKCGLVLLEDEEIENRETVKMRIYCSSCSRPFYNGCVAIADINDWLCEDCILSLL